MSSRSELANPARRTTTLDISWEKHTVPDWNIEVLAEPVKMAETVGEAGPGK